MHTAVLSVKFSDISELLRQKTDMIAFGISFTQKKNGWKINPGWDAAVNQVGLEASGIATVTIEAILVKSPVYVYVCQI